MSDRIGGKPEPTRGRDARPAKGPSQPPRGPIPESRAGERAPARSRAKADPTPMDLPASVDVSAPRPRKSSQVSIPPTPATPIPAPSNTVSKIISNPAYAMELAALALVGQFAEEATTTNRWLRDRYPVASAANLARMAHQRLRRHAVYAAAAAAFAGPCAIAADALGQMAMAARLTLHLAAAHGLDPADTHARAADLLVLTRIHESLAAARVALAAATVDAPRTSRPLKQAARPLATRIVAGLVARRLPVIGPALAILSASNTIDDIARRARTHFA